MTAALLFAATFGVVFALGLQSLNVNGGHRLLAFTTSFAIGASNLVLFKVLPGPTVLLEVAAYLIGGPLGILASMAAHPWLVRRLGRAPAPAPQPEAPRQRHVPPRPLPSPPAPDSRETLSPVQQGHLAAIGALPTPPSGLGDFVRSLLDPDAFGHAVPPEVRAKARAALEVDRIRKESL